MYSNQNYDVLILHELNTWLDYYTIVAYAKLSAILWSEISLREKGFSIDLNHE